MNTTTKNYLQGRFEDYYRTVDLYYPPATFEREMAYIPWNTGSETRMARHRSNHDIGGLDTFLEDTAPQHMYYSAARYNDPGRTSMSSKGWQSADLVFDLDADHFPGVDEGELSRQEILGRAKEQLEQLIHFMEVDFGFEDMEIVFSGNRGYHLHIRDESITELDSGGRDQIADYVAGKGLDIPNLITGRYQNGSHSKHVRNNGGWGRHLYDEFLEWGKEIASMAREDAIDQLTSYNQIGESRAAKIYETFTENPDAFQTGNIEVGGVGMRVLFKEFAEEIKPELAVNVDAPVTTDTHRLIRLPQTIHGGSGLITKQIEKDNLSEFSPLDDAVPDRFTGRDIKISTEAEHEVYLNGETHHIDTGVNSVEECVGIHLMAQGQASKESAF